MKRIFHLCMTFLILVFFNSLCFGMENIINEFRCDHLINFDKSYTIKNYVDEQPERKSVLCPNCAKAELMKRLKKWMNLDQVPFLYCGLLIPKDNIQITYHAPTSKEVEYYYVKKKDSSHFGDLDLGGYAFIDEKNLSDYCQIDLDNHYKKAYVYVCKNCKCERYNDMIRIDKGNVSARNINYKSGQNYKEVRDCERDGHAKLSYSIEIN